MILVAIVFGLVPCVGMVLYFMVNEAHEAKGYFRKNKSFCRWFLAGLVLCGLSIVVCVGLFQ